MGKIPQAERESSQEVVGLMKLKREVAARGSLLSRATEKLPF
jgi:hypothetical protein